MKEMTAFTVVEGDLAKAVIQGSIGRRMGEHPIVIDIESPHWTNPERMMVQKNEHVYVIWKNKLISVDTQEAWCDFQIHFEKRLERDPRWNSYQLVVIEEEQHKKLFYPYPEKVRRFTPSYWAVKSHDLNPGAQLKLPTHKWARWLLKQHKKSYIASDPRRSTRQRMATEHVYGVMEWNRFVLVACVDTEMKWYLFRLYRALHTSIRPPSKAYTNDTIPTRFIVVSDKIHKRIEATAEPIEWPLGRHS